MRNKLTKRIVEGWAVSAIGVAMLSFGSAAATELSPQDRCAIAKLEATWQEAKCLTDAQVRGIRENLTDRQVDRLQADCKQRQQASFKNAEDRPGKCKTLNDDAAVNYALTWATDIPRACGESGPPCNAENPETLSRVTLWNRTGNPIRATVHYLQIPFICTTRFRVPTPDPINPGQIGSTSSSSCLVIQITAEMSTPEDFRIVCDQYSAFPTGTAYRTFQVVPRPGGCVVNRP